ncbi:MAG: hypothetical protein KAT06_09030 [Gammaproteobacteria bacterium]|nr:hypothetical protein [Gammaproteobacteria bacterium]
MKKIKITFLFLLSVFIISCGFHLRGSQDLSAVLPEVQIQGTSQHSELGRELIRTLAAVKVNVVEESETLLKINQDHFSKRVLSLDSSGRANQYELIYQLNFSLMKKVKSESRMKVVDLIPAQNITEKREYLFDANLVLAKADEERHLNNDMRQAAMLQLVRRLMFSLKSKRKVSR